MQQIDVLIDEAHLAMNAGRLEEAERLFQKALELEDAPTAVNNLAVLALDLRGQPEEALRLLQRNLKDPDLLWQPYARALAARCLHHLDRPDEARRSVEWAIRDFEAGWTLMARRPKEERLSWQEYTAIILEALGESGNHRRAWELYQRWSRHHVLPASHLYGGVAAFNLKRFRSAQSAWSRVTSHDWRFLQAYDAVAGWCQQGIVEPFVLDYKVPDPAGKALEVMGGAADEHGADGELEAGGKLQAGASDEAANGDVDADDERLLVGMGEFIRRPANRLLMLWFTLGPFLDADFPGPAEGAQAGLAFLVAAGGDWGQALAEKVFLSPVPTGAKVAAARGLQKAGRLQPDEPVRMLLDGEVREVTFETHSYSLAEERPGWRDRRREALALRDEGKLAEATRILYELAFSADGVWIPALVDYANLLRRDDKLDESRRWLEVADELAGPEPVILFNLAGVCLETGDLEAARKYVMELHDLAHEEELHPELLERLAMVEGALFGP